MTKASASKTISNAGAQGLPATPVPIMIDLGKPDVLTVGQGMEFATLGEALRAAVSGDTIAVQAGTYTNDFGTVSANVSIIAVGGLVHEVATTPPPDDKGILTVNANLAIQGFTFTGGADNSPDGNVSGIRLQSGNLNASYCEFSYMQEGLLADPDPTATVNISHCTFLYNGAGDGYSHNLYCGAVKSLTVTNSFFEGANVGHEIKSRAATTTIENNVIIDGPTGTGSYDIDVPNAGVALISGNIIEKGPNASNTYAIHYGGETQYSYAQNSLSITNNTIINDMPDSVVSTALLNSSSYNGLDVVANFSNNSLWNYAAQNIAIGPAAISGNTNLTTEPTYNTTSPLTLLPSVSLAGTTQDLHLDTVHHTVTGGVYQTMVEDDAGSNTINGGSGGLQVSADTGWDQISTQAGAADTINTPGRNCTVYSNGTDHINASGAYETIEATGAATIAGGGFSTYDLNGANEVLNSAASGYLNIGAAANARVNDTSGDLNLTFASGGRLVIDDTANSVNGGAAAQATISGGAATGWIANAGTLSVTTGAAGTRVQAGSGLVSITGGSGNDTLLGGSGADIFGLGSGADNVTFGSGAASVTAGTGTDHFIFASGADGRDTIFGYNPSTDSLNYQGFSGNAVSLGTITNGNTQLTLHDGTTIDLVGVVLPGYNSGSPASTPATPSAAGTTPGVGGSGGGTNPAPAPISASGGTLTSGGHVVTGTATLLSLVDAAGGNTITGGAGGMNVTAADGDKLTTLASTKNTLTLARCDTVVGAGTDQEVATQYGNSITETGAASISLLGTGNTVQGGAGQLHVTDAVSADSIFGGSGGIVATLAATYDQVTTAAGAADTVSLGGYSTLLSQGTDQITLNGLYDGATVNGAATISAGAGYSTFALNGTDTLTDAGSFQATVGSAASASIGCTGSGGGIIKQSGGTVAFSQALTAGGNVTVTVSGGAANIGSSSSYYPGIDVTAGAKAVNVVAGSGNMTLNGGTGNDVFTGGSGTAYLNLGAGADTVTLGNGGITVAGGTNDSFVVPAGCTGTATIQNWSSQDHFVGAAPASDSVVGGNTFLTFAGGAQVELVGVSHSM